ncbi:MAG: biosynthetic arginine decarboxylase [Deltaproteobacteria bacterium]|nr:biosynthetic arginine decarboxylase [Deltaproteobacteria bacterium]
MDKIQHPKTTPWTIAKAIQYYNIENWGLDFFSVNEAGHISIHPYGKQGPRIDIMDVIEDIQEKKLGFPCVVRFQDILRARVVSLNEAFKKSIADHQYKGTYYGVYPIKVNQMREVVEEILDAGAPYHFGLEAGSKGELLPVLALNNDKEAITVCNGYKDEEFMRLALLGRKLGRKVIIVIEKLSELPMLLRVAEEMQVQPYIGLRAKLTAKGAGKWVSSGGDFAKFGLTTPEIIRALNFLKEAKKEECLKLFHFHVGSQITDINMVREAVSEGARIYAKLCKMGFKVEYFDMGGGMGVDYDGSRTTAASSMNYTLEEYVDDVVSTLQQICQDEQVAEPHIISESGRAITSHHSCIIMPVFGSIEIGNNSPLPPEKNEKTKEVEPVKKLRRLLATLSSKNALSAYHQAVAKKEEALAMFKLGIMQLEDRAKVEDLFWEICRKIILLNKNEERVPEETADLYKKLADQILVNFSLFQTAPDHWAFDQLFPIVPLHRLSEEPSREATLVDITCDSDGKIDRFIDVLDVKETLSLHPLIPGEPYFIGMFMLGAYQDIMGDMHNLFGRVNEVHVFCDDEDPEDFYLEEVIPGDTIQQVLTRLQYAPTDLAKIIKRELDQQVREGNIKPKEGVALIDFYEQVMNGYTYLSTDRP